MNQPHVGLVIDAVHIQTHFRRRFSGVESPPTGRNAIRGLREQEAAAHLIRVINGMAVAVCVHQNECQYISLNENMEFVPRTRTAKPGQDLRRGAWGPVARHKEHIQRPL